ncbi:MAG: ribonuclease P protein component 4 [Methanobacteriota archaeon]
MAPRRNKTREREVAKARIERLLALAVAAARDGRLDRADRYARLARRIGMRYTVGFTRSQRLLVCRGCGAFLLPGRTVRVRLRAGRIVKTCAACGRVVRRPLRPLPPP